MKEIDVTDQLKDYVQKDGSKGLSANDYTDAAKAKVDAIPTDPKYTDTIYDDREVKQDIQTLKDSQLSKATQSEAETGTNDTKYMTPQATKQAIQKLAPKPDLSGYVEKDGTKVLSTNDYTNADQQKLSNIESGAQKNKVTSVQGRTGAVTINKNDIKSMGFPEHVVLTESEFKALSSTQQNAPDIFYYIKE